MERCDHRWALVLAAGEGQRLRRLTTTRTGLAIPKQFCSLEDGPSLLEQAVQRAASAAAPERICAVVATEHRQWWAVQLALLSRSNIFVQPRNRGTAIGILLPLLQIIERDPDARITLLPSDHHVRDEGQLARSLRLAAGMSQDTAHNDNPIGANILLLGFSPRSADAELGYIVASDDSSSRGTGRAGGHRQVQRFIEKPPAQRARTLVAGGALWNAFIITADAQALLRLFEARHADVIAAMREALRLGDAALSELYESDGVVAVRCVR